MTVCQVWLPGVAVEPHNRPLQAWSSVSPDLVLLVPYWLQDLGLGLLSEPPPIPLHIGSGGWKDLTGVVIVGS